VAGIGTCCGPGPSGVPATSAQISPQKIAVDASGNLYIADFFSVVHKVSTNGTMTTIAGNGKSGFSGDGGIATSAQLGASPNGLAIDGAGNVYIADSSNNRIRKVSAAGIITTVVGSGTAGLAGDGGPAAAAQLSNPLAVAVDGSGNLYISDSGNNRIRKVAANGGLISTIAGNGSGGDGGPALVAQLQNPQGLAIDGQGNFFFADSGNSRVREISSSGVISTVAGTGGFAYAGDCAAAASAQVSFPADVAVDAAGNIFIADTGNFAVRRLQPVSRPTLVCGVADAASESVLPVTPGKIVVIYGTAIGPSSISIAAPASGAFSSQPLAGTSVSFNGFPAPLLYSSAGQVSAIVPYEVAGSTVTLMSVSYQGQSSTYALPVAAAAPSIFTVNGSGVGQAAAVNNADGRINSLTNPVQIGGFIQLYATGEGVTSPAGIDGALAPLVLPLPAPIPQVTATVGGVAANVAYAGAAPGAVAGLMQVNIQIPAGVTPGSQVQLVLQVGAAATGPGVSIAVAAN
jgi:uncharacterized protein (TIGR03437 family)